MPRLQSSGHPPFQLFIAMRPLFLLASTCVLGTCSLPRHSVSGQSAGGSMSIQHLVAFSSKVDGCAIAAGSPYGCGSLPYNCLWFSELKSFSSSDGLLSLLAYLL